MAAGTRSKAASRGCLEWRLRRPGGGQLNRSAFAGVPDPTGPRPGSSHRRLVPCRQDQVRMPRSSSPARSRCRHTCGPAALLACTGARTTNHRTSSTTRASSRGVVSAAIWREVPQQTSETRGVLPACLGEVMSTDGYRTKLGLFPPDDPKRGLHGGLETPQPRQAGACAGTTATAARAAITARGRIDLRCLRLRLPRRDRTASSPSPRSGEDQ